MWLCCFVSRLFTSTNWFLHCWPPELTVLLTPLINRILKSHWMIPRHVDGFHLLWVVISPVNWRGILDSSVDLWVGIQSAGGYVSWDFQVKWAECSLIIGTGCWVQVFSLILDSSVGLWVGIQSADGMANLVSLDYDAFDVFFDLRLNKRWVNNREAVDSWHHGAPYDVTVMILFCVLSLCFNKLLAWKRRTNASQADINDWLLRYILWNSIDWLLRYILWNSIDSGNSLVPWLTQFYIAILRHQATMS